MVIAVNSVLIYHLFIQLLFTVKIELASLSVNLQNSTSQYYKWDSGCQCTCGLHWHQWKAMIAEQHTFVALQSYSWRSPLLPKILLSLTSYYVTCSNACHFKFYDKLLNFYNITLFMSVELMMGPGGDLTVMVNVHCPYVHHCRDIAWALLSGKVILYSQPHTVVYICCTMCTNVRGIFCSGPATYIDIHTYVFIDMRAYLLVHVHPLDQRHNHCRCCSLPLNCFEMIC